MNFPALPEMTCPRCGHEETDHDGFGMLACDECGWCSHPDRYGDQCQLCGHRESVAGHVRDQSLVIDAATGGAVSKSEVEALLDVVEAAPRNLACHALPEKVALPPDVEVCGECEACRFNAALARVDGTEDS